MADLTDFYAVDEDGIVIYDAQGYPTFKPRPETKSFEDLYRVVMKHATNVERHHVIATFGKLYNLGLQWDWLEQYLAWQQRRDNWPLSPSSESPDYELWQSFSEPEPQRPENIIDYKLLPTPDGITLGEYLFRASRAAEVESIVVEVDGILFDGDEDSQRRMLSGISAASVVGQNTTLWRLADNRVVEVTLDQMLRAHAAAITRQGELWMPEEGELGCVHLNDEAESNEVTE